MTHRVRFWSLLFCCSFLCTKPHAAAQNLPGDIRFGTELELRHPLQFLQPSILYGAFNYLTGKPRINPLYQHDIISMIARKMYLHALKASPDFGKRFVIKENRILFPDLDFEFQINLDATTLELTHRPIKTREFRKLGPVIQEFMFNTPIALGLRPSRYDLLGAGHLHLDIQDAFGEDAQLFRNFVVDYLNHWELYNEG
jgi:hypothetical protein